MPTYDYDCPQCGVFDALRAMSQRHQCAPCPHCGEAASRVIVAAPSLTSLSGDRRAAFATNERAAHEPKRSSSHGMSCACCSPMALPKGGNANSSRAAAGRPWMISH